MKFYITIEGIPKLKRSFLNLKLYSIISVSEILADHKYSYDTIDDYGAFIVSEKIIELIKTYVRSKRIRGIIYSNEFLNKDVIENLFDVLEPMDRIRDIVLLDDYNVPRLEDYYPYFNEIIFFPSIKKVRLIECKPISKFTEWHK
ncbi:MAG TPA: hypothetical protein PK122_00010 [Candidatus Paceibacterota bacterium]|nr:hypothetical protein [Candidatus Paceibacterota bacterium]